MSNTPKIIRSIEIWPIDKLKPYSRNAKEHTKEQIKAIARLIREGGFDQPIVVDADGVIIKGHGRRLGAYEAGLVEVPVIVRDDLTEAQVKAIRIGDNKVAEGKHDAKLLKAEIADLVDTDLLDALCLTDRELKKLMPKESARSGYDLMSDAIREVDNFELQPTHQVIVEVDDEVAQFALVERLRGEGFKVTMQSMM